MTWLLYMLIIIGIPILFCILVYRLRNRIPFGHFIVPIILGIIIFSTVVLLPVYVFGPVVSDSSYEVFQTFLLALMQFYVYSIITMCLYIVSFIYMKKEKRFIIFTILITITVAVLVYFVGGFIFKEREKADDLYLELYEINTNNSLVGLSKEEVVERLGEPIKIHQYSNEDKETYMYKGGNIYVGIIWGGYNIFTTRTYYEFYVDFDENDKVESTSMSKVI